MTITLYQRTFPVQGAPVALSFLPCPPHQRHTYTRDGEVYEAVRREVRVVVPEGAAVDPVRNVMSWSGDKGPVKSTAGEVFDLATARASGFRRA
ncbi:MAG TPA: hypothetical protein VM529_18975 [Gemmata sp.]|jgi:hypothetical protein|nr:hypothetical protein [Gemmata sp.]